MAPRRIGTAPLRCDGSDTFLAAVLPRKDRAHRCCALVTDYCRGGTLRDAIAHGDLAANPTHAPPPLLPPGTHYYAPMGPPASGLRHGSGGSSGGVERAPVLARLPDMALLRAVLLQIAQGVHFLHSQSIVHGELRADNVLLTGSLGAARQAAAATAASAPEVAASGQLPVARIPSDSSTCSSTSSKAQLEAASVLPGGVCVKLKDIGLCTLSVNNRTLSLRKLAGRARLHAVGWLPPECFKGESISRAADAYAFGILMWECLTGQVRGLVYDGAARPCDMWG